MKKIIPLIVCLMGSTVQAQSALDTMTNGQKMRLIEIAFEKSTPFCDDVVGHPDIAPFPANSLEVSNRFITTILYEIDKQNPLPDDIDWDIELVDIAEEFFSFATRVSRKRHPTLKMDAVISESCNILRQVFHGTDDQMEEIQKDILSSN